MSYSNAVTRAKAAPLTPEELAKGSRKKRKKKPPRKQK